MWIIFIICIKNSSNNYYHAWNFYRFVYRFIGIRFFIIVSEFLTINLIKSLILRHRSSYFFIFSLLSLVESNKCLFPLISSYYPFALLKIRYKGSTFYIFWIFDRHISNIAYKNILLWLFINFNFIWINIFYINNIIERVVWSVFYVCISDIVTCFLYFHQYKTYFILIHYLCHEMVTNDSVFFNILSDNSKY